MASTTKHEETKAIPKNEASNDDVSNLIEHFLVSSSSHTQTPADGHSKDTTQNTNNDFLRQSAKNGIGLSALRPPVQLGGAVGTQTALTNQQQQQQLWSAQIMNSSSGEQDYTNQQEQKQQQQQQKQQQQKQQQQQLLDLAALQTLSQLQLQQSLAPTNSVTHNLIPSHLQAGSSASPLNGTPGNLPALIPTGFIPPPTTLPLQPSNFLAQQPVLTVQDRPMVPPVYNGVNPSYPGLRMLNSNPPVFVVDNFLTPHECDFLIHHASDAFGPAPVVGKGAGEVSPSRTSSTCYLAREDVPDYMRKVALLTGKPIEHCELPQVGRYLPSQQYLQHFDAFDLSNEDGRRFAANGGQRTVTVLVYLNDVNQGGATAFPALNLQVQPRRGMALVFFPATVDGMLDKMALHAALPAVDTKFVSQVWIRQSNYNGQPSKRLPQTLGIPFYAAPTAMSGVVPTALY